MARGLPTGDAEWQECRTTIGRLDSTLADFRKYGFTLVTTLITASGFLGGLVQGGAASTAATSAVPAALMVLITILFAVDRYYSVLLSGAVERALDLEGPEIDTNHLKNKLTQVIAVHAIRSGATYIVIFLYIVLLAATLLLANAMRGTPTISPYASTPPVRVTFWSCLIGIVLYAVYTEIMNKTGYFRRTRHALPHHRLQPTIEEIIVERTGRRVVSLDSRTSTDAEEEIVVLTLEKKREA